MLNSREQVQLKVGQIEQEMVSASGRSLAEIRESAAEAARLAALRLHELSLSLPTPVDRSIRCIESRANGKSYRGARWVSGVGMASGKQARVDVTVLFSAAIESDDRLWFHASITRTDKKMPTYDDLCWLKSNFFPNTWAIQVFPVANQHISHHDRCLHLWSCPEADLLPDFRKFGSI